MAPDSAWVERATSATFGLTHVDTVEHQAVEMHVEPQRRVGSPPGAKRPRIDFAMCGVFPRVALEVIAEAAPFASSPVSR